MMFPAELDQLARSQWSLISRRQILEQMKPHQLRALQSAGFLVPVEDGVYRLAGAPASWRQKAMAACLAYGPPVALSHRAAARLWGIEGITAKDLELTVPPGRSGRRPQIVTHRAPLPDDDTTTHFGIPVTTMPRTLVDLAGVVSPHLLERAIDQAHRQNLATPTELAEIQKSRSGAGRKGNAALRSLLDFRIQHPGIGDSEWVDRAFGWIVDAGLPPPHRQFQVVVNGTVRILDMAYVEEKIAIEFNGYDFHGRRHRFDADAIRTTDLELDGWLVIQVTSNQSPEEFLDRVRRALILRRSRGTNDAAAYQVSAGIAARR